MLEVLFFNVFQPCQFVFPSDILFTKTSRTFFPKKASTCILHPFHLQFHNIPYYLQFWTVFSDHSVSPFFQELYFTLDTSKAAWSRDSWNYSSACTNSSSWSTRASLAQCVVWVNNPRTRSRINLLAKHFNWALWLCWETELSSLDEVLHSCSCTVSNYGDSVHRANTDVCGTNMFIASSGNLSTALHSAMYTSRSRVRVIQPLHFGCAAHA